MTAFPFIQKTCLFSCRVKRSVLSRSASVALVSRFSNFLYLQLIVQRVSNVHSSSAIALHTCVGWEILWRNGSCLILHALSRASIMYPQDTVVGILKDGVSLCCHTCGVEHCNHTLGRSGGQTARHTTTRCCTSSCTRLWAILAIMVLLCTFLLFLIFCVFFFVFQVFPFSFLFTFFLFYFWDFFSFFLFYVFFFFQKKTFLLFSTFTAARLTVQTWKLWLVSVATDRDACNACLRFFSFYFSCFFVCITFHNFCFFFFLQAQKIGKIKK